MLLWLLIPLFLFLDPPGGFEKIYTGPAPSDHFYTDHFDNLYFIDGHKIIKVETRTENVLEYGSVSAGPISSADVSNPLQILLFYRDFNQVLFLDNKLARLRSEISLSELGVEQAVLVCSSGRGGFWVFSDRENRIIYFDQKLRNTHQSIIISSIMGSGTRPVYMTEAQNKLFLYIPRKGILLFDRFASYLKTIPYKGGERFQVLGEKIIYFRKGQLLSQDIESGEISSLVLPEDLKTDDARLQRERIYILSGNRISVFSAK